MVKEAHNPQVILPAFEFTYLSPEHVVLQALRERERLDEVVAPAKSEFEKVLLIKRWVGQQWKFGSPDPYPPWNALIILDWIREGRTSGFCGQYAMVFLQSLLSLGIQARYIELGNKRNPVCHFTTEVWLDDFNKWAVVDATAMPDLTCYYERDGIPLSALELHQAYLDGEEEKVSRVQDEVILSSLEGESKEMDLEIYYNFRVVMNQNQLDFPPKFVDINDTFNRYNESVEWEDDKTVLWEENPTPDAEWFPHRRLTTRRATTPEELYWTLHKGVEMQLRWFEGNEYILYLKAHFPDFDGFLVRMDEGDWKPCGSTLPWRAEPGTHRIEARAKTKAGELGPVSYLVLECPGK